MILVTHGPPEGWTRLRHDGKRLDTRATIYKTNTSAGCGRNLKSTGADMNFGNFQALFASHKTPVEMSASTESFRVAPPRTEPYIDPSFTKSMFDVEKPQVLLVSAVGAAGKSALAKVLSNRTGLPLLNLARHKPVGDNTLTGLLTTAFAADRWSTVLQGISAGTFGIVVDGIDEGRSKTAEQAFNAFLDDVVKLCKNSTSPSFVMLGRTQVLEECWLYLTDKKVSTGLLTIDPFDLSQARTYIDRFTDGQKSSQAVQYREARDAILDKLSTAFSSGADQPGNFLSFIGYPPVLDAIVTLLKEEQNYHRLKERLGDSASNNMEIALLNRIALYIVDRERNEKVIPNIVQPLLKAAASSQHAPNETDTFDLREQCIRLVSYCIDQPVSFSRIADPVLNARYEEQLATFLPEHPFLTGKEFRNAIFEAVALAVLISSQQVSDNELALRYIDSHRHSYYLVYLLAIVARDGRIPLACLRAVIGAALELKATNSSVELQIDGPDGEDAKPSDSVDVEVELTVGTGKERSKRFQFQCPWIADVPIYLGARLSSAYISLPGEVALGGGREIELTAPVEVSATKIILRAPILTLRVQSAPEAEKHILLEAEQVSSEVTALGGAGADFTIAVADTATVHYPLVQHAEQRTKSPPDPDVTEKYLRFRKILSHFRSHSKGAMAKYRDKVENPRVAGNRVGSAVLAKLVQDKVLVIEGPMYFVVPERVDALLGTSWPDLRKGKASDKLLQYLKSISA